MGTLGGTKQISSDAITNIAIGYGNIGQQYYFGMKLPGDGNGERP